MGRIWLGVAIVCVVGFTIYVGQLDDHRESLLAHGIATNGTVLEDPPVALRCGQVSVDVRFEVAGVPETHTLHVDGCGNGLSRGDTITVYYNPSDPSDFITEDSDNETPFANLAAVVALVGGAFLGLGWAVRALRLRAMRATLARCEWSRRPGATGGLSERWVRGRQAVLVLDHDPPVALRTQAEPFTSITAHDGSLLVAGDGDEWVIAEGEGGRLVRAKPPRSPRSIAEVEKALPGFP